MFGMDKKIKEMRDDPEKALDHADKTINKGMTGFVTRTFMGKQFTEDVNKSLAAGRDALEMQKQYQNPDTNGLPATAEVVSIQDTGETVNMNPVVLLQLKVTPQFEPPFETAARLIVSRLTVPRAGDTINIKYAPADKSKISIV